MSSFTWSPLQSSSASSGVTTLNGLSGAVTLSAGSGITLTPVGNDISISASGGSGANTALSNLASVAINDILYSSPGLDLRLRTQPNTGDTTDSISLITGADSSSDTIDTGAINLTTGTSLTGNSGDLTLTTGNADDSNVGDGVKVGDITINLGTPSNDANGGNFTVVVPPATGGSSGSISMIAPSVSFEATIFGINFSAATILTSNADLIFNKANAVIQTIDGSSGSDNLSIKTGASSAVAASGNLTLVTGDGFASGAVFLKSGLTQEANATSGSMVVATGNSDLGPSGQMDIFTGGTNPSGGSAAGAMFIQTGVGSPGGDMYIQTGNSVLSGFNGPHMRFITGDAQVAADGGDFRFVAGAGEGVGHQGDFDITAVRTLKLPRLDADPTGDLIGGAIYYNTISNKIKMYNGVTWETVVSA